MNDNQNNKSTVTGTGKRAILPVDKTDLVNAIKVDNIQDGVKAPKTQLKKAAAENIHQGHRQRLRKRFFAYGAEDFESHQLLELLLCFSIPRGDVNPLAHRLIQRFGSLSGVLEATVDELKEVSGVGENTACLLQLPMAIMRAYAKEKNQPAYAYDNVGKLVSFLRPLYVGLCVERMYLILLDNGMHMIDCIRLNEGSVNCTSVTVRYIAEQCLTKHAACAVLAHNHPKGLAIPSSADIATTERIDKALEAVGVMLLEHLIITDHADFAMLHERKGTLRISPVTGQLDASFYEAFYAEGAEERNRSWDFFLDKER